MDIVALLACFQPLIAAVTLRQLSLIVPALLTMTGRATMLGLARWMEKGGSYRTVRRWFATALPWAALLVQFFQTHLFAREHEFILAGDATTITKAGAQTHGIGLFFGSGQSSCQGVGVFRLCVGGCHAAQSLSAGRSATSAQ